MSCSRTCTGPTARRSTCSRCACRPAAPGCVVVGTYRSDELSPAHPLRLAASRSSTARAAPSGSSCTGSTAPSSSAQMTGILGARARARRRRGRPRALEGNPFLAEELLAAREARRAARRHGCATSCSPASRRCRRRRRRCCASWPRRAVARPPRAGRGLRAARARTRGLAARGARTPRDRADRASARTRSGTR